MGHQRGGSWRNLGCPLFSRLGIANGSVLFTVPIRKPQSSSTQPQPLPHLTCPSTCVLSYGCTPGNKTEFLISHSLTEEAFQENPIINWDAITWVSRPIYLWILQLILAIISLSESLLVAYLGYKVSQTIFVLSVSEIYF